MANMIDTVRANGGTEEEVAAAVEWERKAGEPAIAASDCVGKGHLPMRNIGPGRNSGEAPAPGWHSTPAG